MWTLKLRGGCYDGWTGEFDVDPQPVLIAWVCGPECEGHATFDLENPAIVLRSAVAYRLLEVDVDERLAIYEVGDVEPEGDQVLEVEELVGAGAYYRARGMRNLGVLAAASAAGWVLLAAPALLAGGVL